MVQPDVDCLLEHQFFGGPGLVDHCCLLPFDWMVVLPLLGSAIFSPGGFSLTHIFIQQHMPPFLYLSLPVWEMFLQPLFSVLLMECKPHTDKGTSCKGFSNAKSGNVPEHGGGVPAVLLILHFLPNLNMEHLVHETSGELMCVAKWKT